MQSLRQLHCEPCACEDPAIDGHVQALSSIVQLYAAMHTGIAAMVTAMRRRWACARMLAIGGTHSKEGKHRNALKTLRKAIIFNF